MNGPTYLLDTSFLVDLEAETADDEIGPARRALRTLPPGRVYVSAVTVAEILEGAADVIEAGHGLAVFHFQGLGWNAAARCGLSQSRAARRMGENDAWQAALAAISGHVLVGHDAAFERRPGLTYVDHWSTP